MKQQTGSRRSLQSRRLLLTQSEVNLQRKSEPMATTDPEVESKGDEPIGAEADKTISGEAPDDRDRE